MILDNAPVYDLEVLPNVFTMHMEMLHSSVSSTWEISEFRDDRRELMAFLHWLNQTQTPMIGFNNIGYDYQLLHAIWNNSNISNTELYAVSQRIIKSTDRFGGAQIWPSDRFAPQIDLYKVHHFDNQAKRTSLKALQINMRLANVLEGAVDFDKPLDRHTIETILIPYNRYDVSSTKQFAHFSMQALEFRLAQVEQFGVDVLNWNDSKIGSKILEHRLGDELCYDRSSGRRQMRQTPRDRIALADIIFPFIRFHRPEFAHVLNYMRAQVLTPSDFDTDDSNVKKVQTKGVFAGLNAVVDGVEYKFGTGGIHGSVERQRIIATDDWPIRDIDVASLYPSIAIQHGLAPEHLGEAFTREYANLPKERKEWQKKKGKKCVEANSLKLAANGTYGNSNSVWSVFYDPKYTMSITINGQLMLAMLVEWLLTVPTVRIIQCNTDGVTYTLHRDYLSAAMEKEKEWEKLTKLTLESQYYTRMWIRDVNSYIAEYEE